MSIYISGMEMPKDGAYFCEINVAGDIALITIHGEDRKSFHLVEVSPHGRLIDVGAFIAKLESAPKRYSEDTVYPLTFKDWFDAIIYELQSEKSTPTIIPAEEAQECSEN